MPPQPRLKATTEGFHAAAILPYTGFARLGSGRGGREEERGGGEGREYKK
jgi:hypothetical protein